MKKTTILLITLMVGSFVLAQDPTFPEKKNHHIQTEENEDKENEDKNYATMIKGTVWIYQDGKESRVTTEVTLGEISIKPGGMVTLQNGNIYMLEERDKVYAEGKVEKASIKNEEKRKKMPPPGDI